MTNSDTGTPEADFCVCDYRPRRKCSVHPYTPSAETGRRTCICEGHGCELCRPEPAETKAGQVCVQDGIWPGKPCGLLADNPIHVNRPSRVWNAPEQHEFEPAAPVSPPQECGRLISNPSSLVKVYCRRSKGHADACYATEGDWNRAAKLGRESPECANCGKTESEHFHAERYCYDDYERNEVFTTDSAFNRRIAEIIDPLREVAPVSPEPPQLKPGWLQRQFDNLKPFLCLRCGQTFDKEHFCGAGKVKP